MGTVKVEPKSPNLALVKTDKPPKRTGIYSVRSARYLLHHWLGYVKVIRSGEYIRTRLERVIIGGRVGYGRVEDRYPTCPVLRRVLFELHYVEAEVQSHALR